MVANLSDCNTILIASSFSDTGDCNRLSIIAIISWTITGELRSFESYKKIDSRQREK